MTRMTASDFPPALLELYDGYVHGRISRRQFLDRASLLALGGMTAVGALAALTPNYAWAQHVKFTDPDIVAEYITYPSPNGHGQVRAYRVRPAKADGKLAGVVVVHENRGLNPHIEDIARRIALDGYVAFAPDALTPLGGYPAGGEDEARALFGKLDQAKTREDMVAGAQFLRAHTLCNGKIGAVGFCYGGGVVNMLATRVPELLAGVPFYGGPAPADDVPKIKAQLLVQYAGNDARVNAGWPAYEDGLKKAGVKYTMHMYPGVEHGFNNDTTPRYDKAAAALAWSRTMEFFAATLRK